MVKLFVEGGGDSRYLHARCREGFRRFLERAGLGGRMPRIVACGGRGDAYDSFKTSVENERKYLPFLLVDSETTVTAESPWEHLKTSPGDGWEKPENAGDDQCHLMVQCMESWFLADIGALREYFKDGFLEDALPKNVTIESIEKSELFKSLKHATSKCQKRTYSKGDHSFALLGPIDPKQVSSKCHWAERFFKEYG